MAVQNGAFTRTNGFMPGGSSNFPRFFIDSVHDMAASEKQGRAIYQDEERVEIIMPGNPHTRPVAKVTDEHRQRWPKEYEAFKAGIEMSPDGTPLEEWSVLKRSQVLELKSLGFKTVEHIRDMDDLSIQRIGLGGRRLKELAFGFLDDAERMAMTNKLSIENDRKDAEIASLRRQVEEMGALVEKKFAELQTMRDAPSPLATNIPGMSDPVERAKAAQPAELAPSSLDTIGSRRPGRKPMPRDAEGNIIRSTP